MGNKDVYANGLNDQFTNFNGKGK